MNTPSAAHRSLYGLLGLVLACTLGFIGIASAGNPFEELKDILTKDRTKPPAEQAQPEQSQAGPPAQPGLPPPFRLPQPPKQQPRMVDADITHCPKRRLYRVGVAGSGDIFYMVGTERGITVRLAGNISTPGGRAMLQLLLTPADGDSNLAIGAYYPADYNCKETDRTTPARYLWIQRYGN